MTETEILKIKAYNEEARLYNQGLSEIRAKENLAYAQNQRSELSNSQLKKIRAQVYNEIREYCKNTPRPQKPLRKMGISPLATLMALSNGF